MKRFPFIFVLLALMACQKGQLLENQPPETRIFVDEINLSGDQRLNTVVRLHWSGEDIDGYVQGYEFSQNNIDWSFTAQQDSVFNFSIPLGQDTSDIEFYVRAMDNLGLVDPSPAFLRVPIRNTAPVAAFDTVNQILDTMLVAFSLRWSVTDEDGDDNIDSIFLRANDGPWYGFRPTETFATFQPENPGLPGPQNGLVYAGTAGELRTDLIEGLQVGANNRFYLRGRDISGTFSVIDSTPEFFLKPQGSDLIVIDAHGNAGADNLHLGILNQVYPGFDYLDLQNNVPPFWDPAFELLLKVYDKAYWYSDGTQREAVGDRLFLEVGAVQIQEYINAGGKAFISTPFPTSFNDPTEGNLSPIFGFSPIDSLSTSDGQARIATDSLLIPMTAFGADYDTLEASSFITGVDAFYPKNPADVIYKGQLTPIGGWVGPDNLAALSRFSNGQVNQVFFAVELHKLNGRPDAVRNLIDRVLNVEFQW